jgi:uncharacterized membrane protein
MTKDTKKNRSILRTGLMTLVPTLITIFVLALAFNFLNNNIAKPLGELVLTVVDWFSSADLTKYKQDVWVVTIVGFPLSILIIFFFSYLMATFLGKWLMGELEKWVLGKFPIIKSVYPYAKQFSDLFLSEEKKVAFQKVIAVEYPRKGIYQLAFLTSEGMKELDTKSGKELIGIFIPGSPAPFTGWVNFVPRDEIIVLDMTIDEAIRTLVSGGVLIPEAQIKGLKKSKTQDEAK